MNESIVRNTNPNMTEFGLESDELNFNEPKTFFNGVIEKLNIIVEKDN